jgi:hypothetical protein
VGSMRNFLVNPSPSLKVARKYPAKAIVRCQIKGWMLTGYAVEKGGAEPLLRGCESFMHFCRLHRVAAVLLRCRGDWFVGEPVGVGQ